MPSITITVKFGDSEHQFEIDTQWNILFLKQRVCQLFSLNAEECDLYIKSSRLDEYSKILNTEISDNSVVQVVLRGKKNRFFVYCYECSEVSCASLEWKCNICNKNGFVPSDASQPEHKVSGTCSSNRCESTSGTLNFHCIKSLEHCPVVYLQHVNRNLDCIPCIACLSEDCELIVTICDHKTHALCLPCFKTYATEYLEEGLFTLVDELGYTLGCPAGCPNAYVSDPHHFRLIGKDFYSRYKEFSVNRFMLTKDSAICPACGQRSAWVTCAIPVGCGKLFCPVCNWQYSDNATNPPSFGFYPIWRENRETIARICRPCPRCKTATEKAGGCNHMHCSRCGFDWCWICCDDWTGECQSLHCVLTRWYDVCYSPVISISISRLCLEV
ncbi:unnamed protein product [Echinostoma caproni]|uniref:RBR-type E3 ubiquitin transferase n=1 Tax=Echinostoma caproni TaxID=27848 RepID=A0A183B710_9TREM|nr:unnamed protein product [Echinostoma caproni]